MNMKTTMGLVALAMLALTAMTPTAAADPLVRDTGVTNVCVYDPVNYWEPWCGENNDTWATIEYDAAGFQGCITTNVGHPFSEC